MLAPVRTAAPATTPITLAEAKAHLRVTTSDDDTIIGGLVQAATDRLDAWYGILGRALVTQTWRVDFSEFDYADHYHLPFGPVQSVTSVAYWDVDNVDTVFSSSNYTLHHEDQGYFIRLSNSASWPSLYERVDAVRITFVAGYGAAAAVPEPIKIAIKFMVAQWYSPIRKDPTLRSETVDGVGARTYANMDTSLGAMGDVIDHLISGYRVMRV